jgi:hypothetical protein
VTILARFFVILQARDTIFCGLPVFAPIGVIHPTDRSGVVSIEAGAVVRGGERALPHRKVTRRLIRTPSEHFYAIINS